MLYVEGVAGQRRPEISLSNLLSPGWSSVVVSGQQQSSSALTGPVSLTD